MKRAAVFLALALAVAGCAPKNYVVLLDNPGGGSGKVIVSNQKGRQVLDQSGSATAINRASRPPSSPWRLEVKKIQETFAKAFGARPPRFVKYTVYFKSGRTDVDKSSVPALQEMLREVARRPGVDITVAGHADRKASDSRNEILSLLRAWAIRDELVKVGVPIERIEIDSWGESRPLIPTPDNVPELKNRRVEVTVR
jgi:outer membrane protein OmpA-like peptidoglycan-associated protein